MIFDLKAKGERFGWQVYICIYMYLHVKKEVVLLDTLRCVLATFFFVC